MHCPSQLMLATQKTERRIYSASEHSPYGLIVIVHWNIALGNGQHKLTWLLLLQVTLMLGMYVVVVFSSLDQMETDATDTFSLSCKPWYTLWQEGWALLTPLSLCSLCSVHMWVGSEWNAPQKLGESAGRCGVLTSRHTIRSAIRTRSCSPCHP